jgi:hypothetical protein
MRRAKFNRRNQVRRRLFIETNFVATDNEKKKSRRYRVKADIRDGPTQSACPVETPLIYRNKDCCNK